MIQLTLRDASGQEHKVKYKDMDEIAANISLCGCGSVDVTSPDGHHVESIGEWEGAGEFFTEPYVEYLMERKQ